MAIEKQTHSIRKEQILQASIELISKNGVRGMSIINISRAVGIVPSAIYRHYKNKDEILKDIVNTFSHNMLKMTDIAEQQEQNPLSRIKKVLYMHVQLLIQNKFFPIFMFSEEVFVENTDVKQKFKNAFGQFLNRITQYLIEAKKQNLIRQDLSERSLTTMYLGLFLPIAMSLIVLGQDFEVISQVDLNWDIFLNGITQR